jgi:hypothetical protein
VNGWIVKYGKDLDIPCPENEYMVEYVKQKLKDIAIMRQEMIEESYKIIREAARAMLK